VIASLRGTVLALKLDFAVIDVGGVGMAVSAPPNTLATLRIGEETSIATHLVVREDSLTLFGFATEDERDTFVILQTVSGVGPRLALAMVAVLNPDELRRAVSQEDLTTLTKVPGIGKKSAQRIVLELGEKLGPPQGESAIVDGVSSAVTPAVPNEVVEALIGLGWNAKAAEKAVRAVMEDSKLSTGDNAVDVGAILRAALQELGGNRG